MANPDARFGLRPVRYLNGAPWNGQTSRVAISASYATALFIGDPVDFETTLGNKGTSERYPTVIRCAMTDATFPLGVIVSFDPNPANLTQQYRPASTARYANIVYATPDLVFQIRDDGAAALSKVVIGQNAVGIFTHAGDTITGLSGLELNSSSTPPAADATYPLTIIGCADIEDNEWDGSTSTHTIWEVVVNGRLHVSGATGADYGILGITAA